jgi:8-oxo-dGTP pyrophosphatase MutT (NUDIX family)
MAQKYKVYFAQRPVIFSQELPAPDMVLNGCEVIRSNGKVDTILIESAILSGATIVWIHCENVMETWISFSAQFEFVQAAGGVVRNSDGKILFIYRLDKWDLPKGKVEYKEAIADAALREVEEECGIELPELVAPLCETWHTYVQNGQPMLKSTAWFVMNDNGSKPPLPQSIEGITETRWLSVGELDIVLSNTYDSVVDVLNAYAYYCTNNPIE